MQGVHRSIGVAEARDSAPRQQATQVSPRSQDAEHTHQHALARGGAALVLARNEEERPL